MPGVSLTLNLVQLFEDVCRAGSQSNFGSKNEEYWKNSFRQLLSRAIDLIRLAQHPITLPLIKEVIDSAPTSLEEVEDGDRWQQTSACYGLLLDGHERRERGELSRSEASDFQLTFNYWTNEFPKLAPETRSIIVSIFTGMADALLSGSIRELFCEGTNLTPEDTFNGKIMGLDLPLVSYGDVGRFAQSLVKYLWQRAALRRAIQDNSLPVFLWIDEAQFFVSMRDRHFQNACRDKRVCSVFMSQNISNYYAAIGGGADGGKAETDALLGCLGTSIFHQNSDAVTNAWAADLIARDWQSQTSYNFDGRNQAEVKFSQNQSLEHLVGPIEFQRLRKGGPQDYSDEEARRRKATRRCGLNRQGDCGS
ncbi:MAG: hypothetical protein ACFB21_07075 [Opitutales bacterium]